MDGRTGGRTFETHFIRSTRRSTSKRGHMTLTTPIRRQSVIRRLELDILYLHTKYGASRFGRSGDLTAGVEVENWSCDPDHGLLEVDCHH